jgi:hypothetical protein
MASARGRGVSAGLRQLRNRQQVGVGATRYRDKQVRVLDWREGRRGGEPAVHKEEVDELNQRHG